MILKELGGFDSFTQRRAHFNIFPYACNVKITNLIWSQVTDIQILRYTNCAWWYPYKHPKRRNRSVKNSSSGVIANIFEVELTNRLWWPDLTWPCIFFWSKYAQWMFGKSRQVWFFYLAAFGNDTRKPEGGGAKGPPPGIGLKASLATCWGLSVFTFFRSAICLKRRAASVPNCLVPVTNIS